MIAFLLAACAAPVHLSDLEPLSAVSLFRFVAMAGDERRVLAIMIPDLIVDGEMEAEADLAGWSEGQGLEMFIGKNLGPIVVSPEIHSTGWGRCLVEERWYAVEGHLRVSSATPFEQQESESVLVEVEDVVLVSESTSERREVAGESWTLPLAISYDYTEGYDYLGAEVGGCTAN